MREIAVEKNNYYSFDQIHHMIDASLSSCHEKATVALSLGRIRTRLGVDHFPSFPIHL